MENSCEELYLPRNGHRIFCRRWLTTEPVKARANILIAHGMGEHSARYGEFARKLNDEGFNVIAPDLRGHGRSLKPLTKLGDMGHNGWQETLTDLAFVHQWMTQNYKRPAILFGHSMGAMLAQQYAYTTGQQLSGVILSGAIGAVSRVKTTLLKALCKFDGWRLTPSSPSPLVGNNIFRLNNRQFERDGDGDGGFAWLSRDKAQVAIYRADPLCGATLSSNGLADMFASQIQSTLPRNIQRIDRNVVFYLFAGSEDPLNNHGKSLVALHKRYQESGLAATLNLYPDARHEMLNELNRDDVIEDVIRWFGERANV